MPVKVTRLRPPQVRALRDHMTRYLSELSATTAVFIHPTAGDAAAQVRQTVYDLRSLFPKGAEALSHVGRKLAKMAQQEEEEAPVS